MSKRKGRPFTRSGKIRKLDGGKKPPVTLIDDDGDGDDGDEGSSSQIVLNLASTQTQSKFLNFHSYYPVINASNVLS